MLDQSCVVQVVSSWGGSFVWSTLSWLEASAIFHSQQTHVVSIAAEAVKLEGPDEDGICCAAYWPFELPSVFFDFGRIRCISTRTQMWEWVGVKLDPLSASPRPFWSLTKFHCWWSTTSLLHWFILVYKLSAVESLECWNHLRHVYTVCSIWRTKNNCGHHGFSKIAIL